MEREMLPVSVKEMLPVTNASKVSSTIVALMKSSSKHTFHNVDLARAPLQQHFSNVKITGLFCKRGLLKLQVSFAKEACNFTISTLLKCSTIISHRKSSMGWLGSVGSIKL